MNGPDFSKYTKRISYKRDSELVSDGAGGTTAGEPVTVTTLWADVNPVKGNRALEYQKLGIRYPYEIEHYYRGDVELLESDWIEYNGKRFTIHSLVNDEEENWKYKVIAWLTTSR